MKYVLLPLSLILSYHISYFTIYLIVLLIPLLFSLSWGFFIIVWFFLQYLFLSVIGGITTFINTSLSNYYKNTFITILHSISSVVGLFQIVMFFNENPPVIVVEGVDVPMFKGMWDSSWFKSILTILFFIPYVGIPISICLSPILYRIEPNSDNV